MDIDSLMNGHLEPSKEEISPSKPSLNINPYLEDAELGLALCANLVANPDFRSSSDQILDSIDKLINHDFLQHTEHGENTSGANAYAQLLEWFDSLEEAISFPQLQKSHTAAVGGSFSAGKTRFLNTVLGSPSLLPVDTTPTTSIPTFLFKGESNRIDALNFFGKKTDIDEQAIKAICHAFNKKYQVTFSHILKMIAVERASFNYENLIFLDTPGYSKSDNQQKIDENIARNHLRVADYLIWLVDSQNGTVPQQDIDFLQSLELEQPILVVMSKADKRLETEIKSIIEVAKTDLDNAEINYLDVIGYSAVDDKEISENGSRLKDFLDQVNQRSSGSTLQWRLSEIFNNYHREYLATQQALKLTLTTLNELIFDESLFGDKKKHLTNFYKKVKSQIDDLSYHKRDSEKIHRDIEELLCDVCLLKEITMSSNPSVVQLNAMRKKADTSQSSNFNLDAFIHGDQSPLSHLGNLDYLKGEVTKISPLGLSIRLHEAPGLAVMLLKNVIYKTAPSLKYDHFYVSQEVNIQIISNTKASVSISVV